MHKISPKILFYQTQSRNLFLVCSGSTGLIEAQILLEYNHLNTHFNQGVTLWGHMYFRESVILRFNWQFNRHVCVIHERWKMRQEDKDKDV